MLAFSALGPVAMEDITKEVSQDMYTFQGRQVFETVAEMVDPKHTVVMVHDMQNDFLTEGGAFRRGGEAIDVSSFLDGLVKFVAQARGHGVKVWQTNYTDLPDFGSYDDPMVSKRWVMVSDPAKKDQANPSILGTWGCQTIDELKAQDGDIIINKYRTNTFVHSNFELLLRSHGIRTVISTGVATEVGILPTSWTGIQLGFFPVIPRDLVGSRQPELHEDAMKFMERLVWVVDSSEILEAWEKGYP
ncbi:MAG: cysteine hydrolase [Chloroflexi bacterium]|nr:cysteine hydrolase [Chloroflexota bacterium]